MPDKFEPAYLKLHYNSKLKKRANELWAKLESCQLCPRNCQVNRLKGETGICKATAELEISSYNPHFGEEKPLVGTNGSGTIFFTNCGLRCVFCINGEISNKGAGRISSIEELAAIMLQLQEMGCHNINLVTPTHYIPHILKALNIAAGKGLKLPLVYNTSGYEHKEVLQLLDGIVDIYLPDFKYFHAEIAVEYSPGANQYPEYAKTAILEMQQQVGVANPAKDGIMNRGLMIRHLVMPNNVSGTKEIIHWIASNLPKNTYLNIMSQYRPEYNAYGYPKITRNVTRKEYTDAIGWAMEAELTNLDIQGY